MDVAVDAMDLVRGYDEIKATGYTKEELNRIEWAFENAGTMHENMSIEEKRALDPSGLWGFINVINTLGEIHGVPEISQCVMEAVATGTYKYCSAEFEDLN